MNLADRILTFLGFGPKFIMAEPGTDPIGEPELYKRHRRRGGLGHWLPFVLGIGGAAATWGVWFYLQGR